MLYESTQLKQVLAIRRIYTIHYYEYDRDFSFDGEAHDFWEFVYADRGDALLTHGGEEVHLRQGTALLHAPNVFHTVRALSDEGLNLMVVSFACEAKELLRLTQAPFPIFQPDKQLLSSILTEARDSFSSPLDSNYFKLRRSAHSALGSEQFIGLYLQNLLLQLLRRMEPPKAIAQTDLPAGGPLPDEQLNCAVQLMQEHLQEPLSIQELCHRCHISRSKLQRLFRQHTGQGALNFYIGLRMEAAKGMIRNRMHSYGEIADALGFSSIHYFSRQFKQVTGMTPSEYKASLRSLSDKGSC